MLLTDRLTTIANAIRSKTGKTEQIPLANMPAEITGIKDYKEHETAILNREVSELVNDKVTAFITTDYQKNNLNLTKVDLPLVPSIKDSVFNGCKNLTEINLPGITSMGAATFAYCPIENIYLPKLETVSGWGSNFSVCGELKRCHFPRLTNITAAFFNNCKQLETLILGADTVCALANVNSIPVGTKIRNGEGYVYVPKKLIDMYRYETNWSDIADCLRAIEDYPEVITEEGFFWAIDSSGSGYMTYTNKIENYPFNGVCPRCGQEHRGNIDYQSQECPIVGGAVMFNSEGVLVEG